MPEHDAGTTDLRLVNRELEERIAEQAAELAAVYEQIPSGVIVVDWKTGAVRVANARALEILGPLSLAALVQAEFFDLGGRPMAPAETQVARALAGEKIARERVRVAGHDGLEKIIEIGALPVSGLDGGIASVTVTVDDVTEREAREHSDRQFIINAAHQLRTPLTAIVSAVAALDAGAKKTAAGRERFLGHIARETERMIRLVEALLTLARLERGGGAPTLTIVPVRPLLQQACTLIAPPDVARLRVDAPDDLGVVANRDLLLEVVLNLVTNAVVYAPHGDIELSGRLDDDDGDAGLIEVADSGPGVPVDQRTAIFDRFFRASENRQGAGLGLSIAGEAMRALQGTIELVDTPPGQGSTFRLRLPAARIL